MTPAPPARTVRFRHPLGLVLSGGGAHGAWQAAVVDRLHGAYGMAFDHILSFSIGSLTGAAYFLDRMSKLTAIWKNISAHRILRLRPRLYPRLSFYSNDALWEVMRHAGSEERARERARCDLTSISFCTTTGSHAYSKFTPNGSRGWDGPLTARLVASCSIPKVFPPVTIPTDGPPRTYIDGGVQGKYAFRFDSLKDCRDVIVLQMTRPEEIGRKSAFGYLARKMQHAREGLHASISKGLEPLRSLPEPPRIFRFYPSRVLEFSMLQFESRHCIPALYQGFYDADYFMSDPGAYLE